MRTYAVDLPILDPEEDLADDFATIYLHLRMPERLAEIAADRARQHLADGAAQRAGRGICLAYGLDPGAHSGRIITICSSCLERIEGQCAELAK